MSVMMACSPSTGSSLLRRILNRHSSIFCGSETHILAKDSLYLDWKASHKKLLSGFPYGLRDKAWVHFRGIILDEEYRIDISELKNVLAHSDSMQQFIVSLSQVILQKENKTLWIEKTPTNALCAEHFLNMDSDSKLIHITRNPYDVISSLMNRGLSTLEAVCRYLINTSHLAKLDEHDRCYLIRYEDLVANPQNELSQLLMFIGLEFEESMLSQHHGEKGVAHMKGWSYKETAKIEKGSVNKFELLDAKSRNQICSLLKHVKLKDMDLPSFHDICSTFNYKLRPFDKNEKSLHSAKRVLLRDRLLRSMKFRYFNHFNYPFYID